MSIVKTEDHHNSWIVVCNVWILALKVDLLKANFRTKISILLSWILFAQRKSPLVHVSRCSWTIVASKCNHTQKFELMDLKAK